MWSEVVMVSAVSPMWRRRGDSGVTRTWSEDRPKQRRDSSKRACGAEVGDMGLLSPHGPRWPWVSAPMSGRGGRAPLRLRGGPRGREVLPKCVDGASRDGVGSCCPTDMGQDGVGGSWSCFSRQELVGGTPHEWQLRAGGDPHISSVADEGPMALGRACPPSPLLELGGGTSRERKQGAASERGADSGPPACRVLGCAVSRGSMSSWCGLSPL